MLMPPLDFISLSLSISLQAPAAEFLISAHARGTQSRLGGDRGEETTHAIVHW